MVVGGGDAGEEAGVGGYIGRILAFRRTMRTVCKPCKFPVGGAGFGCNRFFVYILGRDGGMKM